MQADEFDLVGFAVGVVEREQLIDGSRIAPGDLVIGLSSPGLRSNGYSLARAAFLERGGRSLDDPAWPGADRDLAEELLVPSVIYAPAVLALQQTVDVRGVAHITGGGISGNVARILPPGCGASLQRHRWETPRIFLELQHAGRVTDDEMARVFNLGIGMVVIVPEGDTTKALETLIAHGVTAQVIGEVDRSEIVRLSQ